MRGRGTASGSVIGALLFCAAATILAVWPQVLHISRGLTDLGDAKFCAWVLNWNFHQLFSDPLRLFDANIFFPARLTLAFSENLLGISVFGFPLFAAGASPLTVYNVLFLIGMFLSASSAWALALYVTGDAAASLVASLVYAFLPWRLAQLSHLQFQWGAFLPLLLLFLLRYLELGRRRDLLLFAVCFTWNGLCNLHYGLFAALLVSVVLLWELSSGGPERLRRIRTAVIAWGLAGVALIPTLIPYWKVSALYGVRRSMREVEFYSGRLVDFLTAGPQNKLYAGLTQKWAHPEGDFFPGITPVFLAVYGLLLLRKRNPDPGNPKEPGARSRRLLASALDGTLLITLLAAGLSYARGGLEFGRLKLNDSGRLLVVGTVLLVVRLLVAFPSRSRFRSLSDFLRRGAFPRTALLLIGVLLLGFLVALGVHTPYYRFLLQSFGAVFGAIRVPARGIVLFHLALAILAAWGLSAWTRRVGGARRAMTIAGALVLTAVEYRAAPVFVSPVRKEPAPIYRWLREAPAGATVLELPIAPNFDAEYVFRSTAHWKRLVNGVSGYYPPHYDRLFRLGSERPIPTRFWAEVPEGTGLVILHAEGATREAVIPFTRLVGEARRGGRLELIGDFPHDDGVDFVFRLVSSPRLPIPVPGRNREEALERFAAAEANPGAILAKPFGVLDFPREGARIPPKSTAYGWALDDSGIDEIRVTVDDGPSARALTGGPRPDVAKRFPRFPEAHSSGFGLRLPDLHSGSHVLHLTLVARDGGQSRITVRIRVCEGC